MSFRLGDCLLDIERRELLRGDTVVPLTPKAFQLLQLLVEKRPRAVSKAEIYDRLWPATFVTEVNLSRLMFEVRSALRDDARRPCCVRTVRRYGYALCSGAGEMVPARAEPDANAPSCWLVWTANSREFLLGDGENVVGRAKGTAVRVDSTSVSRHHARIVVSPEGARLEDMGSKNGTYLGGKRVAGPVRLVDGDLVRVGSVSLVFRSLPPDGSTSTGQEE